MRAYQLHAIGDLRLCEVEVPALGEGDVLVRVTACGICSSDIPRIYANGTYRFPTVPGHEFSGTVVRAGGEAGEPWVGKRVGVFPLIPCKACDQCKERRYEMCRNYDYLGSRSDGGFAEFVKVPVWNLVELPDCVPFSHAAMLEPSSVALHAAKAALGRWGNATPPPETRFAVSGTGAIGMLVARWYTLLGGRDVTVLGRNEHKRPLAEAMGARYVNTLGETNADADAPYDALVEAVGTPESLQQCLMRANAGARIVAMGNPAGDMTLPRDAYWKVLRNQLQIIGVWNSAYEHDEPSEWSEAVSAMASGQLNVSPLITHETPFDDLPRGLGLMRDATEPYCKVMVVAE